MWRMHKMAKGAKTDGIDRVPRAEFPTKGSQRGCSEIAIFSGLNVFETQSRHYGLRQKTHLIFMKFYLTMNFPVDSTVLRRSSRNNDIARSKIARNELYHGMRSMDCYVLHIIARK